MHADLPIALAVAFDEHMVMGRDNQLPWHLPSDLRRFRALTLGKAILMGRRTHDSIGRALPGRLNIVLSRDPHPTIAPQCLHARSLDEALALAAQHKPGQQAVVIGGAALFEEALPRAQTLYISVVHACVEGDVFFPWFDSSPFSCVREEFVPADGQHDFAHHFLELVRGEPGPLAIEPLGAPRPMPPLLRRSSG